ncbi:MAG TPA: type II toxin-antitoxin system PemK/MazF family toxin [Terriglobia bacterium]|nr:type II toxin-antitoxin system PemK/MazF family toxin [Terriglobia bacterium]
MIRRGEIWWASLPEPAGSEPGYRRPVLVVQTNEFNEGRIRTVIVLAITSNLRLAGAPGNVLCRTRDTGLARESVINVSQTATVNKARLTQRIAVLPSTLMKEVEAGLRVVLGL